ncbi:ABC transporter substrate-binding protein [Ilumatobacter sp.]|uniref:ABC transporter substrate-binding protein n=1 Tax=Ilumatobacter sp. TaxID=1967498 RepID=UPI003752F2A0
MAFTAACGSDDGSAEVSNTGETTEAAGDDAVDGAVTTDASASGEDAAPAELITATVGVVGPKSGIAPFYFTESLRGFELAIPEIEERFGVRLEIIEADDEGSPEVASREVQKLLNETEVDAILGPAQSGPALQVAEIIQRAGRPWLISVAAADQVLDESVSPNWGFRFQNTNQQAIDVTADLLFKEGNTVGIFYSAEGYGQSNLDSMKTTAEARGQEIASEEGFEPGTPDLTSAVRRMKDAGVNSVFIAVSNGSDIASLMRAMEQVGFEPETKIATQTILTEFAELTTPEQRAGIVIPDPRDLTGAAYTGLMEMYEETYGEPAQLGAAVFPSYSAALAYGQAVAEVGDATDYEAVRLALEGIAEFDVNGRLFETPFGATDRSLYDSVASTWYLHEFGKNGEIVSLGHPS